MTKTEIEALFRDHGITKVKVGGFDLDGVLRGKFVSLEKFWSAVDGGMGFCDVVFGWDIADVLYDNAALTGWHTGYPDIHARIDLGSFRPSNAEHGTAHFLLDFVTPEGEPHPACPRGLLKKVIARAAKLGFAATFACELEFFVFKETPESLREKGYRGLTPISPGMFGYSWVREEQHAEFCHAILDEMESYGIPIEGLHTETGPGVYEAALRYQDALRMADNAALFKTQMKSLCARRDLVPTFMAKWNAELPGSSGHLHQSLFTIDGGKAGAKGKGGKGASKGKGAAPRNAFYDAGAPDALSETAKHYLAGQLELMPELTALYAPTVNAYKRYVPGVWAPLNASWGLENRTCAIRAIRGGEKGTRLEYRQTAADINPYVAIATCLAAGLWGIEQKKKAPKPATGDGSSTAATRAPLPRTLREATALLAGSKTARTILGADFVDHYVRTRDWECRQYEKAVTDWELRRYFESL